MTLRTFLSLLVLAPAALHAGPGQDEAQARLRSAVDEVLNIAKNAKDRAGLVSKIGPVLSKHISFDVMTRRAIGPGWRTFTPAQQKDAVKHFTQLIIRSYSSKFTIGAMPEISYKSAATPAAGRVDVTTTTTYQGSRYNVIYRMEQAEGWRTTDVVIEGVSMVANYRSQFDPVFKKGGAEAVLRSLEQSAARPQ